MSIQIPKIMEWQRDNYIISTDQKKINREVVYQYLSQESYWAIHIPVEIVHRSLDHSLCFGVLEKGKEMVGFARVVSDYATFANLMDVFILPPSRGLGLSKWLLTCIFSHPDLQNLRCWSLKTRDAHGLYRQYGFQLAKHPEKIMERIIPDPY
ncbi:MAG: GNAT family N-acetyltransferase [Anaerolineaceae bacterium]|nr:GNAT family N-acetyltransferase [Anaerolineaceae bacterium]